jgi:hypothetical protein
VEELVQPERPEEPPPLRPSVLGPRGPRPSDPLEHSLAPGERDQPAPPTTPLARYDELDVLGSGGSGVVTLAVDRETGERVAIKRLRRTSAAHTRRFRQEAETIAALDHPGIVRLLHVVDGAGHELALVLELVEGPNLEGILRADGRLPLGQALEIGVRLAEALAYAHAQKIVHRDVKPSNVLIGADGQPKLVDFGLAAPIESIQSAGATTGVGPLGTFDYMAPEQWACADAVDGRADVYALGATLYRLLTGASPRVIREGRLPPDARALVLRCVEEDPDERWPSMTALGEALSELLARVLKDTSGVHAPLERVSRELQHDLAQARERTRSQRLLVATAGLSSLGALPADEAREIAVRRRLGEPVDELLCRVVDRVLERARRPGRARLLSDAHAVLSAALVRPSLGAEGRAALARLEEASREPVVSAALERLADVTTRLVRRRALSAGDARALAAEPGDASAHLEVLLGSLRRRARVAISAAEWRVQQRIWRHALEDLLAALPDEALAARIERERLAVRMEALAREAEG